MALPVLLLIEGSKILVLAILRRRFSCLEVTTLMSCLYNVYRFSGSSDRNKHDLRLSIQCKVTSDSAGKTRVENWWEELCYPVPNRNHKTTK